MRLTVDVAWPHILLLLLLNEEIKVAQCQRQDRQAENIMPQAPFVGWAKAYAITNKP